MPRQDQQDQPPQLVQRPRARQALNQGGRKSIYTGDADEDTGNWSDSDSDPPSESHDIPGHRAAAARNSDRRRRQERQPQNPSKSQHETYANASAGANANDPGYSGYKTGAGGQAVRYGDYSNPFAPVPQPHTRPPPKQYTSNPHPSNQHPPASYPAGAHPAGPYDNNDVPNPPNYFQGRSYPQPVNIHLPKVYPYPGNPYIWNPYPPQPQPSPRYGAMTGTQPLQPMTSPSPLEDQLEQVWKELEEVRMDQDVARKQEEERQKAERKQAEAAARKEARKKEIDKLRRHFERLAKAEVNKTLRRDRAFGDSDTRSDPGRTRLNYDMRSFLAPARQMQDDLPFWDERKDREFEELAQSVERHRGQGGRRFYGGSVGGNVGGPSTNRIEAVPSAFYGARVDPTFRTQVEDVVMDLLWCLRLDEKEDRLPLPPVPERAASDGYAASEGQQRSRDWQSDASNTKTNERAPPPSSHKTVRISNDQEQSLEFGRSAGRQQGYPASSHRPGPRQYPRKSQAPRNDTSVPSVPCDLDTHRQVGREAVDSGYSSTRTTPSGGARDTSRNIRFGGRGGQPTAAQNVRYPPPMAPDLPYP